MNYDCQWYLRLFREYIQKVFHRFWSNIQKIVYVGSELDEKSKLHSKQNFLYHLHYLIRETKLETIISKIR